MTEKTQKLPYVIENKFWDFVIPLLESENETVEWLVNLGYRISQNLPGRSFLFQAIFWICMGTIIGLALGLIAI